MNCYIIHLSRVASSARSAEALAQQLTNYGISWQLFEGSYGNVAKQQYESQGRGCHAWGFKGPDRPLSDHEKYEMSLPGVIGCFDSHYRLWQLCVELGEPIMVFEDDTRLIRPLIPVEFDQVLIVATSHDKKLSKYRDYLTSPSGEAAACEYRQASMPGTAGYIIKPAAAKILVDAYQHSFLPSDNAMNQTLIRLEIHNYLMGQAQDRDPTGGKSSLVKTDYWNEQTVACDANTHQTPVLENSSGSWPSVAPNSVDPAIRVIRSGSGPSWQLPSTDCDQDRSQTPDILPQPQPQQDLNCG